MPPTSNCRPSAIRSRRRCARAIPPGVGSALPGALDPGEATLLTVKVTPGKFPDSTGIAVVADVSAIGGLSTPSLVDDGTSGDAVAGDKTFSWLTTVAAGTTPGSQTLTVTIADAQHRSSALTIRIDVQQPVLPISGPSPSRAAWTSRRPATMTSPTRRRTAT